MNKTVEDQYSLAWIKKDQDQIKLENKVSNEPVDQIAIIKVWNISAEKVLKFYLFFFHHSF